MRILTPLHTRFETFVKGLEGYEHIDDLLRQDLISVQRMRADYLFKGREIIVEQKTLVSDPVEKTQRAAEKVMTERSIIVFGEVPVEAVFSTQPDADRIRRHLLQKSANTVSEDIANADKQIRDTRLIFQIPEAIGILVFLNESAKMLTPEVLQFAIMTALQKRTHDGRLRYSQIDGVIVISKAQPLLTGVTPVPFPINLFVARGAQKAGMVNAFSDMLAGQWAAYNGAPLIHGSR